MCLVFHSSCLLRFLRLALTASFFDMWLFVRECLYFHFITLFFFQLQVDRRNEVRVSYDACCILFAMDEQLLQFFLVCLISKYMACSIYVLYILLTDEELVGSYFYVAFLISSFYLLPFLSLLFMAFFFDMCCLSCFFSFIKVSSSFPSSWKGWS